MNDASLPHVTLSSDPLAARRTLDASSSLGAIELPRPPLTDLPYRAFVEALLRLPGFRLDFRGQAPEAALAKASDQLFGPGAHARERALFAADIAALAQFAQQIVGGDIVGRGTVEVAIRTYFAPGDLVWHLDRMGERQAVRLLWPIGRAAGMRLLPRDAIDPALFAGYMRREYPLLCRLDAQVLARGGDVAAIWTHRPVQLAAMMSGDFPFLLDRTREVAVSRDAASVHRVETPQQRGSYHRTDWANRAAPGLQLVMTATAG